VAGSWRHSAAQTSLEMVLQAYLRVGTGDPHGPLHERRVHHQNTSIYYSHWSLDSADGERRGVMMYQIIMHHMQYV